MYKEALEKIRGELNSVDNIINFYGRECGLFFVKNYTDYYYELIFNRQFTSPVYIPTYKHEDLSLAASFYLDDDDIILSLKEMICLVLVDRFDNFIYNQEQGNKIKNQAAVKRDLSVVNRYLVTLPPFTYNNKVKLHNRIRVVKTFKIDKQGNKTYFAPIGDALLDKHFPNSEEDIRKYAALFNDPINVVTPEKAVYCSNRFTNYIGVGYSSNQNKIISLFKKKSNLPERLRQHYSSNYLEPVVKHQDYLLGSHPHAEKAYALCVFLPIQSKIDNPFGDSESPVGKNTLSAGEILINKELSNNKYYLYRSFQTASKDVDVISVGTKLKTGDAIAWDIEGVPSIVYDSKHTEAEVVNVIEGYGGYRIVVKILSELSVARIISDYGIKGVTHPREELGMLELPDGESLPVQMIVGPNSLKSGSNGIRLSWLALKQAMKDEVINIIPEKITVEDINKATDDIRKLKWTYKGKDYQVYAGFLSFGVTDLAKDCKTDLVRVMPETMKYMFLSENKYLTEIAETLLDKHIKEEDKWLIRELFSLINDVPKKGDVCYDYTSAAVKRLLQSEIFDINNSVKPNQSFFNEVLLNPLNNGFFLKINDRYIKFPSAKLIKYQSTIMSGLVNYKEYFVRALWLLYSIKLYNNNKATEEHLNKNIDLYMAAIKGAIYEKRAALSDAISPLVHGGHFKQLVSSYVPKGITVIVDRELEHIVDRFRKENNIKAVSDIGVRNPIIWRYQFVPRKLWTLKQFKRYLEKQRLSINDVLLTDGIQGAVLRNTIDVLYDQSDTDGDLYPVSIPLDVKIQNLLHEYRHSRTPLFNYEQKWAEEYITGECNNENFYDVENKPFEYHEVDKEWFSNAFANAAIAKMRIGPGTIDLWRFHATAEFAFIHDMITREQMLRMQFLFSRIVQDYIIRSIKHVDGGSSNYDIYNLRNFKADAVKTDLINFNDATEEEADLFIKIALLAKEEPQPYLLSRLPNGGTSVLIDKLINKSGNITDNVIARLSYARILGKYCDLIFKSSILISDEIEMELSEDVVAE